MYTLQRILLLVVCAHVQYCSSIVYQIAIGKLTNPGAKPHNGFAKENRGLAASNEFVVVGAPYDNTIGSVTVFKKGSGTGTKIIPSDGKTWGSFGRAVAINSQFIVVGSRKNVYIYDTKDLGKPKQKLSVGGNSIAINSNNDIVVGVKREGKGGAAFVYKYNNDGWSRVQKLAPKELNRDRFGMFVAMTTDFIVVSSRDYSALKGNGETGAVFIFQKNKKNVWERTQTIFKNVNDFYLGYSIAMYKGYLVLGAPGHCTECGALIYKLVGSTWVHQTTLRSSNQKDKDRFGSSVAIYKDELVVGTNTAYSKRKDLVVVFEKKGQTWKKKSQLKSGGGRFGYSVAINKKYAYVGSDGRSGKGAVYVYDI